MRNKRAGRKPLQARYAEASDEAIRAKWLSLRPRVQRSLVLFAAGAVALFAFNHFGRPSQQLHDYATAAYQICMVFSSCLLFMTVMTYVFGRNPGT
jgi:hypothetical protein